MQQKIVVVSKISVDKLVFTVSATIWEPSIDLYSGPWSIEKQARKTLGKVIATQEGSVLPLYM